MNKKRIGQTRCEKCPSKVEVYEVRDKDDSGNFLMYYDVECIDCNFHTSLSSEYDPSKDKSFTWDSYARYEIR